MFYVLFVILFLIFFLCYQHQKERYSTAFINVLVLYFIAICSMMIYFSRDTYYYNIIKNYFYLPDALWRKLFFFPLSRFNTIRFMNLSSLGIVLASVYFVFSFHTPFSVKTLRRLKIAIWIYLLLQFLIYDPAINLHSYYFLFPDFLTSNEYYTAQILLHNITKFGNNLLILSSIFVLLVSFYHSPRIQLIRYNFLLMTVCYCTLSGLYFSFISRTPTFLLRISKYSQSYYFWYIDLGNNVLFYTIFPIVLVFFLLLTGYCLYKLTYINTQIEQEEFEILKQIDATETTSKIFCHYIKNELLAIQSELEFLHMQEHPDNSVQETICRCENLYNRIDDIHKSTKASKLHLVDTDLKQLLEQILKSFQTEMNPLQVHTSFPDSPVIVLADPVYLEQALHNIICNATDAMEKNEPYNRLLTLTLQVTESWIHLNISDNV